MKSYTTLRNQFGVLTNNTTTDNLLLGDQLINDSLRYLTTKYFFNERTYTVPGGTIASTQNYKLPNDIKTILNIYVSVGTIRYQLKEAPNRSFWDSLNFVPYTSDVPQFYYIYNKQIYVFPTPASSSNVITINYKCRLKDLSQADYTTGTVTTNGTTAIVGVGTTFINDMEGRWLRVTAPTGDNEWYEISTFNSTTSLTLVNSYKGDNVTGASYAIGEMPILPEDYQDLPVYRAASIYFTSRVPDKNRADMYQKLYDSGRVQLDAEFGSKSWSVAITPADSETINPNLFTRNVG